MTNKLRIIIAAVITLWASAFVGIKAGLHDYSPEALALLRYLVASIVMGVIYLLLPKRSKIKFIDKAGLLLVGVVGIGAYNLTLNNGETSVSSGVSGFIASQTPVITTVFAVLFLGEQLSVTRLAGFALSITGVTLIAAGEIGFLSWTVGLMYLFAALITGSLYSIMQKPYMRKYNAIEATAYVIWGGTIFLFFFSPHFEREVMNASFQSTLTVIYLGVFPAAIAYAVWAHVLSQVHISHAVSYVYAMPFISAGMAYVFLGEVPSLMSLCGAVLAILGVWLIDFSYQQAPYRLAKEKM